MRAFTAQLGMRAMRATNHTMCSPVGHIVYQLCHVVDFEDANTDNGERVRTTRVISSRRRSRRLHGALHVHSQHVGRTAVPVRWALNRVPVNQLLKVVKGALHRPESI